MKGWIVYYNGDTDFDCMEENIERGEIFIDQDRAWSYCIKKNNEHIKFLKRHNQYVERSNYYMIVDVEIDGWK